MKLLDFITGRKNAPESERENNNPPADAEVNPLNPERDKDKPVDVLKPSGMSEEDYRAALTIFPPERVRELYQGFDPKAAEPLYEQLYRKIRQQPVSPDEKQIRAARTLANLGDALGLIVQSVAASQGSYIDPRNPDRSATVQTLQGINRLKEAYQKNRNAYDMGLLSAGQQDLEGARQRYDKDRATLLDFLLKMRDNANRDKRFQGEMEYKYERLKSDEAARRDRKKHYDSADQVARAKLGIEQQKLSGGVTPPGYLDFFDRNTGITYRVPERKWKANFTQIFNQIKEELYKQYPLLKTEERMGKLKAADKEEYVKQFMYSNPEALGFLDDIAENKFQDGKPSKQTEPAIQLKPEEMEAMKGIVDEYTQKQVSERETLVALSRYLKAQGYTRDEIERIIRMITH